MRVKATKRCFIDNVLRDEGDVFEYNGPANVCVESLDAPADDRHDGMAEPERRKPGRPRKNADTPVAEA